ncbi:S-layer homology domain-containing protein [Paenibacillus sp. EPM92]|uniref:S-layer homology domain-containing protein n=1 Tax=Paenibacillus sp. EPM92 TaxID=1561195 RepID=UPI0019156E12|nr:S-layer homology domain-containing protein [Paenibacillus sp. EPM92]
MRSIRKLLKTYISAVAAGSLLLSCLSPFGPVAAVAAAESSAPVLLVTEIHPNNTGDDDYEFIEIYNNSDRTLKLNDYSVRYYYPSDGSTIPFQFPEVSLPSGQTVVLWYNKSEKTVADFNSKYGTSLNPDQIAEITGTGFTGLANSGSRGVVIRDAAANEITRAIYVTEDIGTGLGVYYRSPLAGTEQAKLAVLQSPTPGTLSPGQVPDTPVHLPDNEPPVITHTPVTAANVENDVIITASITNPEDTVAGATYNDIVTAAVYYKSISEPTFLSVPLVKMTGTDFSAAIPRTELKEAQLQYYIQAKDSANTVKTDTYTVQIAMPDIDFNALPPLMVTELVPDSTNVGLADGYEFIEIYNNSDKDVNFKDYKIYYRYTDSGPDADVVWPTDVEDFILPSKQTMVFWIINAQNQSKTVADFNAIYGTNLQENVNIMKMRSDGMANGGKRGIVIATNTHKEISVALYDNDEETQANKGIFYKYAANGAATMIKYSAGLEAATPGTVAGHQVPLLPVMLPVDTTAPTIEVLTGKTEVEQWQDVELVADAKDDQGVKTVAVFYKTDQQSAYTKRYLKESFSDTMYHHKVFSPELIGRTYVDYYFAASDGTNTTTSPTYRLLITGGLDTSPLRMNVKDGDTLSGRYLLKTTSQSAAPSELSVAIDNEPAAPASIALENEAYFAFDVTAVNYWFKNAVTDGQEILFTFDDTINDWTTLTVPINPDRLEIGDNVLSIRAGSKASPFDTRQEENKDDFQVKNIRLVLADGTELYDDRYTDREQEIKMGDSSGRFPVIDFKFHITEEKFRSKAYEWDTTKWADGSYTVKVIQSGGGERTATVNVDNTAPSVQPTVVEGEMYKGPFIIDAAVSDASSGLEKVETRLDGAPITFPYATSSSELQPGEHTLIIQASDKVGNRSESKITFFTPNEHPSQPELIAPQQGNGTAKTDVSLAVKVTDPTGDAMKVSFYKGYAYGGGAPGKLAGYRNTVDYEPPKQQVPAGETAFGEADYMAIAAKDGQYVTTDSDTQFPYQRFQVQLDPSVKATDTVELKWQGASLEGRKVTMYAWDETKQEWEKLAQHVAGAEDFELYATFEAGKYSRSHTIDVLIQDEIPPTPDDYDYSFVWMSDTQYYSESYPHIYEDIVNWIADKKDEMNIKYVIHTGDLVDEADKPIQWQRASDDMAVLEKAGVPYGVLAGNHDVDHKLGAYDHYWNYFGEDRFKKQPTFGGSYDNNRGHYDLISSHGNDFIVLYMGWGLGDKEIQWMDDVLKQYPDRMAILNFHEYLLVSGNRAPIADKVFERVVVPNKNVIAVLSGHYHDAELLVDEIDDDGDGVKDRNVYQMLADYQGGPEGGQGYIRLMQFDTDNNKLNIKTYSPYLDDYNYYDPVEYPNKDEFTLTLDLQPKKKRVATDYMGVNVYTDQRIGQVEQVASGSKAEVVWNRLPAKTLQQWYAVAEDAFGGRSVSGIWNFKTGPSSNSDDDEEESGDDHASSGPQQPAGQQPAGEQPKPDEDGRLTVKPTREGAAAKAELKAEELHSAFIQAEARTDGQKTVTVKLDAVEGVRTYALALPSAALMQDNPSRRIEIVSAVGTVVLPGNMLTGRSDNSSTVTLTLGAADQGRLSEQVRASVGDRPVIELEMKDGDRTLAWNNPDVKVKVSVPYKATPEERSKSDHLVVLYIDSEGQAHVIANAKYDLASETIVFETTHFSTYAVALVFKTFDDLNGLEWAKRPIEALASRDIIEGTSEKQYSPAKPITRADFVTLLVKTLGLESKQVAENFKDVQPGDYYYEAIAAARKLGIAEGSGNDTFRPNDPITRQDTFVLTERALKAAEAPIISGAASLETFADGQQIADYAKEAVAGMVKAGFIEGSNGRVEPLANITRAETAVLMYRIFKKITE